MRVDGRLNLADLSSGLLFLGHRPVELCLRDDAVAQQPFHPLVVETCQLTLRFDRRELCAFLTGVELGQHLTFTDRSTRLEGDAIDGSRQICTDSHTLHRSHRPDGAQCRRPLLLRRDDGRHRCWRWLKRRALGNGCLNLLELHESQSRDENQHHREH